MCDPLKSTDAPLEDKDLKLHTIVQFAATFDCVWNLRNQVVHKDHQINIVKTIQALESRIAEHILTLKEHAFAIEDAIESKELHPHDTFILNVDAAVSSLKATVAVVARDLNGNLIMDSINLS